MILIIDSDASKVIDAIRATGVVITRPMIEYTHYLIKNMKAIGTWDLCNAVYGIVGGTAASHKFNWKNPIDTDAAFRLVFQSGWTHSTTGAKPNGSTYASTFLNPSVTLTRGSTHISYYSGTNDISGVYTMSAEFSGNQLAIYANFNNTSYSTQGDGSGSDRITATISKGNGYFLSTRNSLTDHRYYLDGGLIASSTSSMVATTLPNSNLLIGALSAVSANGDVKESRLITIGAGFTSTQAQQQSQISINAQNILNRA